MTFKIIQPSGLGDVIATLKIARELGKEGKVYWPVVKNYSFIKDYIKIPNVEFNDGPGEKIVNLQSAGLKNPDSIMEAKYQMMGMSSDGWQDAFDIQRNYESELIAFAAAIESKNLGKRYAVIGNTFATPPDCRKIDIDLPDMPCVNLADMFNWNPFDCSMLIEKATEIHLVDTCFAYIIEKLNLSTDRMVLYSRNYKTGPSTHKHTRHLWRKKWEFVN